MRRPRMVTVTVVTIRDGGLDGQRSGWSRSGGHPRWPHLDAFPQFAANDSLMLSRIGSIHGSSKQLRCAKSQHLGISLWMIAKERA